MPRDPTIAIRDCLSEIAVLHDIAARMTLQSFRVISLRGVDSSLREQARGIQSGLLQQPAESEIFRLQRVFGCRQVADPSFLLRNAFFPPRSAHLAKVMG